MDERIVNLVSSKNFVSLTTTEKDWVLDSMTEAEYQRLHEALQLAPAIDEKVAPSPHLRASLMAQFDKPVSIPAPPQPAWYLIRVPVWQAAAVLLLVAGGVASLFYTSPKPVEVVRTIQNTDTVYVEKIVWKERVIVKKVKIKAPPEMAASPDPAVNPEAPATGTSVAAQPELMQFFTSSKK